MSKLFIKESSGKWTPVASVDNMNEAEIWARERFKDYDDSVLRRTITDVIMQGNTIYLHYDIQVAKDGNVFPVKVIMKVEE